MGPSLRATNLNSTNCLHQFEISRHNSSNFAYLPLPLRRLPPLTEMRNPDYTLFESDMIFLKNFLKMCQGKAFLSKAENFTI